MRTDLRRISGAQLVTTLAVTRVFSLFTYVPRQGSVSGQVTLLSIPLSVAVCWLLLTPFLRMRKTCGPDLLVECGRLGKPFSAVAVLLFLGACLLQVAGSCSHFAFFMTSSVYQTASREIFIGVLLVTGGYAAALGLEAFSRAGSLLFAFALLVMGLMLAALLPEIRLSQLYSPLAEGVEPLVRSLARTTAQNVELILFVLLLSRCRPGHDKRYLAGLLGITALLYEIFTFLTLTVLGDYSRMRLFPLHTLATVAEASVLGRMDLLHILLWSAVGFLRVTLYLYGAATCLHRLAKRLSMGMAVAICAFLTGVMALAIPIGVWDVASPGTLAVLSVLVAGFPLAVLAKKRFSKEESAQ